MSVATIDPKVTPEGGQNDGGQGQPPVAPEGGSDNGGGQDGGVSPVDFKSITGGSYESWDQVQEELKTYKTQLEEVSSKKPEYADPFIQKYHELADGGASQEELRAFTKVQTLPIGSMTPEQLIMEQMRYENPYLSDSDIAFDFNQKYGQEFDEETDPNGTKARAQQIALKKDGAAAQKFFEGKKLEVAQPDSVKSAERARQARESMKGSWEQNLKVPNELTLPVSFKDKEMEYAFDLKVPGTPEVRQALLNHALSNGMQPTPENIKAISEQAAVTAFLQDVAGNLQSVARDAYAKGLEAGVKSLENVTDPNRPKPAGQIKPATDVAKMKSELAKRAFAGR